MGYQGEVSQAVKRSPMRRKSARRIQQETDADRAYVAWIHWRPCCGIRAFEGHKCVGVLEQSHLRSMTGLSRKEPPMMSVPMCSGLHRDYEQHKGPFAGWTKEQRRDWFMWEIENEHAAFERGEEPEALCPF